MNEEITEAIIEGLATCPSDRKVLIKVDREGRVLQWHPRASGGETYSTSEGERIIDLYPSGSTEKERRKASTKCVNESLGVEQKPLYIHKKETLSAGPL